MNNPFNFKQVKALPLGFTPSCTQIGVDKNEKPIYYPNRRQRRALKRDK